MRVERFEILKSITYICRLRGAWQCKIMSRSLKVNFPSLRYHGFADHEYLSLSVLMQKFIVPKLQVACAPLCKTSSACVVVRHVH